MSARIDLTGKTFGYIKVIKYSHTKSQHAYWYCHCEYCKTDRVIGGPIITRGVGKCRKCAKRKFDYNKSLEIAKDHVNGYILKDLMEKYDASSTSIYSAIDLITNHEGVKDENISIKQ